MRQSLDSLASEYDFTGRNVLVTGGAGFIGSHLVDALAETNTVTVLDNLVGGSPDAVNPDTQFVEGDVRDRDTVAEAVETADVVFHQAGLVSVSDSITNPVESQSANVDGTLTVLDCARQHDTRVVVASSAAVYGEPDSVPVPETAQKEPTSPYGIDKLAVDHYTRQFADRYGLPTVALRYFNVYGPGQTGTEESGVIDTFVGQATRDQQLTVDGDGTQTRDFVHVGDVVRANILAATTDHTGEAFNIGTDTETSITELARTVAVVFGADQTFEYREGRPGDIDRSRADTQKTRDLLGFESTVGLVEGLETMVPAPDPVPS